MLRLRNLSALACVYVDQPNGMIDQMLEERSESLLGWFTQVYLPLRLL